MAIITKITTQQKNQDRFNIFMDYGKGEEFAFSVDSDVLIKFQLKKGMELDDFSFLEIQYQDDIRKAYNLAIHYLARRMRSEKEIKDYLEQKEMEEPVINEVLHKLTAQKYINDQDYALSYVRTQMNTSDKGPDLIKMELKEKGIKEEIFEFALAEFPFDVQVEKATKISGKFIQKNSKESQRIIKQKLENLLLRKGYSYEIINIAVSETDMKKDVDEEMEAIRFQGEKTHRKFSQFSGFEYEQKMKQTLYRKGFSFELIEKFLAENHEIK
ncbi:recombination regulator RecX [Neobacillus ginsengisoli]|uniref:Regulatory protein RecX n=1 Tax=Neobacillus ginsengisoli TaxID=904295 RepID=A0ABT9XZK7_9BACI|nr:recombination regulator RecX [Neobacillus ginsengisoli]MDQ0200685.1 regulatory protein [Neobacillus ginsengisoli]